MSNKTTDTRKGMAVSTEGNAERPFDPLSQQNGVSLAWSAPLKIKSNLDDGDFIDHLNELKIARLVQRIKYLLRDLQDEIELSLPGGAFSLQEGSCDYLLDRLPGLNPALKGNDPRDDEADRGTYENDACRAAAILVFPPELTARIHPGDNFTTGFQVARVCQEASLPKCPLASADTLLLACAVAVWEALQEAAAASGESGGDRESAKPPL